MRYVNVDTKVAEDETQKVYITSKIEFKIC